MEKGSKYNSRSSQKIKIVLAFIHKHCGDKLPVKEIACLLYTSDAADEL